MVLKIDPETYYDERTLRIMGLDGDLLESARDDGRLRYRLLGSSVVYKGQWVLDWLDLVEPPVGGAGR